LKSMGVGVERNVIEDDADKDVDNGTFGCSTVKRGEEYAVLVRPDCHVEVVDGVDEVIKYLAEHLPGLV
jgi:phenol 2-monooxygenase